MCCIFSHFYLSPDSSILTYYTFLKNTTIEHKERLATDWATFNFRLLEKIWFLEKKNYFFRTKKFWQPFLAPWHVWRIHVHFWPWKIDSPSLDFSIPGKPTGSIPFLEINSNAWGTRYLAEGKNHLQRKQRLAVQNSSIGDNQSLHITEWS